MMTSSPSLARAAVICIAALSPTAASAQDGGLYVELFGGLSALSDAELGGAITGSAGFGSGSVVGLAVGYDYRGSPFRSELEYAYRTADADPFGGGASGDLASTTLAVNGYYDFRDFGPARLTPYVGAGLAYVTEIDFDIAGGGAPGEYNDTGVFGYQLMAGASYAVSDRISLTGEVRYFDAGSQTLNSAGGSLTADYNSLDVIFGIGLDF